MLSQQCCRSNPHVCQCPGLRLSLPPRPQASAIAQQSITQIRTVAAYNREEAAMRQYENALEGPRKTVGAAAPVRTLHVGPAPLKAAVPQGADYTVTLDALSQGCC